LNRRWLILGGLAMAVPIVVLSFPYAVGAYHLEAGGRALDQALGEIDPLDWWYVGPIEVQDGPALGSSIAHLENATRYTHALRLLARAYAARGDLLSSIEALRRYTAQRPDNPMGHLELAAAYGRANELLQGMYSVRLLDMLPGAMVSAPDLPGETQYQPEGWESEYAYPTTFTLPPDEEERPTLFLHAGSQVTYTLTLTQPVVLRFAMGLDPRSLDWGGDGVTFEVAVDGVRVFLEHLPVAVAREGWQERQVDLSAYAGQAIVLSLASTPGPAGDVTADWAGWGAPRVEVPEAGVYRSAVEGDPWRSEWALAGVNAAEFVAAGEVARKAEHYDAALTWYEWAMQLDPDLGDPWYCVGLIDEERQQWAQALAAYERAIALDCFHWVGKSNTYYRAGMLYELHLGEPQIESALAAYKAALDRDDFSTTWEAADCHYRQGMLLMRQDADAAEYTAEFRQAITLAPGYVWAHIQLARAVYAEDRDAILAEVELLRAVELDSQNEWAYYYLGQVYQQEGRTDRAEGMYEQALAVAPGFREAQTQLTVLRRTD
jgi:tetratricopeptide (TPR) repeat protein